MLLAEGGRFEAAKAELEIGEPLIRVNPNEHAKFLCKKAKAFHRFGDATGAGVALEEARQLALNLGVLDESELSQTIAKLDNGA